MLFFPPLPPTCFRHSPPFPLAVQVNCDCAIIQFIKQHTITLVIIIMLITIWYLTFPVSKQISSSYGNCDSATLNIETFLLLEHLALEKKMRQVLNGNVVFDGNVLTSFSRVWLHSGAGYVQCICWIILHYPHSHTFRKKSNLFNKMRFIYL